MVEDIEDPRRTEPPFVADERSMLEAWLDFHRTTLLLKCEGLDAAQLVARPVASSELSLHGLVRHLADVERSWFSRVLLRDPQVPPLFHDPDRDDLLVPVGAEFAADLRVWQDECERSRQAAAGGSLDDTGLRHGRECSLRWIYVHMIEEYARHNGHADLIRELIDGSVGG